LHHSGSQEVTPVVVPDEPEEQPEMQEQEVPEANEEVGEDLLKYPDHRPSSFERGKPQSISLPVCKYFINALL
jgi:NifB/MoaA-like Fe-S oxidoreductase